MRKEWRTYFKGDLVYVQGAGKQGFGFIPAFIRESQTMKDIVEIYAFGDFDEHSSSYLEETKKEMNVMNWVKACEGQGYKVDYVLEKMEQFKISSFIITRIKSLTK